MMSQPASACTSACRTSTSTVSSLTISPSIHQPVMAVAGIGVERHVAHDADVRHRRLDGAHRPADQIVGVERLAGIRGAQSWVVFGKQRDGRNAELGGFLGLLHRQIDRSSARRPAWRRPARCVFCHR